MLQPRSKQAAERERRSQTGRFRPAVGDDPASVEDRICCTGSARHMSKGSWNLSAILTAEKGKNNKRTAKIAKHAKNYKTQVYFNSNRQDAMAVKKNKMEPQMNADNSKNTNEPPIGSRITIHESRFL
jgi:hypothetical protein